MVKLSVADAHPSGNKPFKREDYIHKFKTLTKNIIDQKESENFLNNVQSLRELGKSELYKLNIEIDGRKLKKNNTKGIF